MEPCEVGLRESFWRLCSSGEMLQERDREVELERMERREKVVFPTESRRRWTRRWQKELEKSRLKRNLFCGVSKVVCRLFGSIVGNRLPRHR